MNNKKVSICPNCGEPLVWTFINVGSEWYCLNCKNDYPMFGANTIYQNEVDKEEFDYLEIKQKMYKKIFKEIEKDLVPYTAYRKKCKKCDGMKEHHYNHLTNKEKLKDKVSREILEKINFSNEECD